MTIPLFLIHNVIHWLTAGHLWNPMHQFAHLIERGRRARNQAQWKERGELDLCTLKHSLDCRCSRTIAPEGWVLSSVEWQPSNWPQQGAEFPWVSSLCIMPVTATGCQSQPVFIGVGFLRKGWAFSDSVSSSCRSPPYAGILPWKLLLTTWGILRVKSLQKASFWSTNRK
jgi:hypothetical protein